MAAVIGDPIEHSLSPAMHNAAFESLGLDWLYAAFRVPKGGGAAAVEAMRTLDLAGMSVTMPHKADVAAAVDVLGPVAAVLGVANTVAWSGEHPGVLVGESTDGAGFLDALSDERFNVKASNCVVFGSGGAARSVIDAAVRAGAAALTVVARDPLKAASCAALAGRVAQTVSSSDRDAIGEAVDACDLVVNATPVGMGASRGAPAESEVSAQAPMGVLAEWFRPGQLAMDLVYYPAQTCFMETAAAGGARAVNGLGMLVHQARRQVELWTGELPPVEVLFEAAKEAIRANNSETR